MTRGGAQNDKGTVILRSESDEESFSHAPETGGKILRCAQNDNGGDRMTGGVEVQNDNGRKAAIRWRALPPPLSF